MKRREFLKISAGGLAAIGVGSMKIPPFFMSEAHAAAQTIDMTMEPALVEMVDLTQVFCWVFATPALGPSFPGPVILATQGDKITINLTNNLTENHAFRILGTAIRTPPIAPGRTKILKFKAPAAGTYLYVDPLNAPVNRVLGLHGAMVVLPKPKPGNTTPYTLPTRNVRQLFNDLGTTAHFPGDPWSPDPASPNHRERIWLFHQIDPRFNTRVQAGEVIAPADILRNFLPRYFFISGKTGAFADEDPNIAPEGNIGEPHLIRMLNAGIQTHSPHNHANHLYLLAVNQVVQSNVVAIDTFTVGPTDTVDWLLPFIRPPDIPGPDIPLRDLISQELHTVNDNNIPQSPLMFPMHGHTEIDQTAAGGNYPQGLITKWMIIGDVDKVPFP